LYQVHTLYLLNRVTNSNEEENFFLLGKEKERREREKKKETIKMVIYDVWRRKKTSTELM